MGTGGQVCCVLGGDQREIVVVHEWLARGWLVYICGLPPIIRGGAKAIHIKREQIVDILPRVSICLLPVLGLKATGCLHHLPDMQPIPWCNDWLSVLPSGANVFIGSATGSMRSLATANGVALHELLLRDDFSIYNAIPTAEGAIASALQRARRTLHGSSALVLGFGRCGSVLAEKLQAMRARVTVAARNATQRAHAKSIGCDAIHTNQIANHICRFDFVFNTVPAKLLDAETLIRCRPDVVITDIASLPGGVDRAKAEELGLSVALELGLPGRVAPESAGWAIIDTVDTVLTEE